MSGGAPAGGAASLLAPKPISTVPLGTAACPPPPPPPLGKALAPVAAPSSEAPKGEVPTAGLSKATSPAPAEPKAAEASADAGKPTATTADGPAATAQAAAPSAETSTEGKAAGAKAAGANGAGDQAAAANGAGDQAAAGTSPSAAAPATSPAAAAPAVAEGDGANGSGSGKPAPSAESVALRKSLVRNVFKQCDGDGDGFLSEKEMLRLAVLTGFEGTATKWSEEYKRLCTDNSRDPSAGVDIVLLEKLLNDSNDEGEPYTSDEELQSICTKLEQGDKNGLEALMAARAAAEVIAGLSKAQSPTGPLAARLQTAKVPGLPMMNLAMNLPKVSPVSSLSLQWHKVLKPATALRPANPPYSKIGGPPIFGSSRSLGRAPRIVPPRVVPPPAAPPPMGRISVRGLHVAMPMEVEEFFFPGPEGSSPKVLGGTPPPGLPTTHFSKSAGAPPLSVGDAGSTGAHPKDASPVLLEDFSKTGA